MRTAIRTWAGCVAAPMLMLASSPAWAQAPPMPPTPPVPPKAPVAPGAPPIVVMENVLVKVNPPTLEQVLAEALKNNPDVRVAESKLREAEAQLHRARMQVMQKAVTLRGTLDTQEGALKEAEASFKAAESRARRAAQLRKNNAIDEASVEEAMAAVEAARQKLLSAKTRLAELEGEMNFLQGKNRVRFTLMLQDPKEEPADAQARFLLRRLQQDLGAEVGRQFEMHWVIQPAAPGSVPDKLRKAFDKPVRVDIKGKPLADVLKDLEKAHGVNFVVATKKLGETSVTIQTEEMPLGAVLEMLEDMAGVRFAVRDYGVLATGAEQLPVGAVPLYTFWKAAKPQAGAAKPKEKESKLELEVKP